MFAPDFQAIHGANYPRVAFSWPPRVSAHSQRDSHIPNTLSKVSTPVAKARKIRPLFSYSYRLLFPQLPCFDIHLSCLGVAVSPTAVSSISHLSPTGTRAE